jgi:hypothetical protein
MCWSPWEFDMISLKLIKPVGRNRGDVSCVETVTARHWQRRRAWIRLRAYQLWDSGARARLAAVPGKG